MFSGIIEGTAQVHSIEPQPGGMRLTVALRSLAEGVKDGDSIAIDGVCLTVATLQAGSAVFNVVTETLRKTTLGELQSGSLVNIERSIRVGDRIDGHFVQGHVEAVGEVVEKYASDVEYKLWIAVPALQKYFAPRGSVAVSGVSLTIAEVDNERFAVALIPTTLERTNLGQLKEGSRVNIEPDIIARQVVHVLEQQTRPR